MKKRDLRAEAKRIQEWYGGNIPIARVAEHLGVTEEELSDILNPAVVPKAPKAVKVSKPKTITKESGHAPLISRAVIYISHYGGTVALAAFEILFFVSLAGSWWFMQLLLGLTAVVFTLGEVGLWEKGTWEKVNKFKLIAACMALFSFIGGAAVSLGEVAQYERASSIVDTSSLQDEYDEYTGRIKDLEEKLAALPETWITRIRETSAEIDKLVVKRTEITLRIEEANKTVAEASETVEVFVLASKAMHMPIGTVALVFLLLRTFMLIVVTLSTSPTKENTNATITR